MARRSMTQPDFFSLFLHPLNSTDVPYMITGAVASTIYGEPRLTQDIDLVLDLDRKGIPRLTAAFPADRYYVPPDEALEEEVGRPWGGHFNLLHLETGLRADCYLAGEDEFNRWGLDHRRVDAVGAEPISIAPPEYVIVRKLEYRRQGAGEHHLDDVARMLRISRALIDQATLDGWIARAGVTREWREVLDRLARMG
jgi:hypothetical protein